MNASGYNALAETITANIGGNLTLASLQNTDSTSGRSDRFGGGNAATIFPYRRETACLTEKQPLGERIKSMKSKV